MYISLLNSCCTVASYNDHLPFQVFLSSRAVYVIVFNLCHDLSGLATKFSQTESTPEVSISFLLEIITFLFLFASYIFVLWFSIPPTFCPSSRSDEITFEILLVIWYIFILTWDLWCHCINSGFNCFYNLVEHIDSYYLNEAIIA